MMRPRKKRRKPRFNHRHVLLVVVALLSLLLLLLSPAFLLSLVLLGLVAIMMAVKLRLQWLELMGFEIGYFFTLVMGFVYGPRSGFLFGVGYVLLHWAYGLIRDPNIINLMIAAVLVPLMGLTAGFFPDGPYVTVGMAMTLVYVVTIHGLDFLIRREINPLSFVSPFGQLALNYILLSIVTPFFIHARG